VSLLLASTPTGSAGTLSWTDQNSSIAITELSSDSLVIGWTSQNNTVSLNVNLNDPISLGWTSNNSVVAITGSLLDATALNWTSQNSVISITSNLTDNLSIGWTDQNSAVLIIANVATVGVSINAAWTDSNSVINGTVALLNNAALGIQGQNDSVLINSSIPVNLAVNWQDTDSLLALNGQVTSDLIVSLLPLGGDDHKGINWQAKQVSQKTQTVTDLVDNAIEDYYKELTSKSAPKKIQHKAAKIVKPYALDTKKISQEIDFSSLRNDINRAKLLLSLYIDYIQESKKQSILTSVIIEAAKRKSILNKMAVVYSYVQL
jgi:hypothetical protein